MGDELLRWASRSPETAPIDKSDWLNYVKSFKDGELLIDIANSEWENLVGVGINTAIRQSDRIYDYVDWNSLSESKADEEFKEDEHPREDDGQFASKGSGSSSGSGGYGSNSSNSSSSSSSSTRPSENGGTCFKGATFE